MKQYEVESVVYSREKKTLDVTWRPSVFKIGKDYMTFNRTNCGKIFTAFLGRSGEFEYLKWKKAIRDLSSDNESNFGVELTTGCYILHNKYFVVRWTVDEHLKSEMFIPETDNNKQKLETCALTSNLDRDYFAWLMDL